MDEGIGKKTRNSLYWNLSCRIPYEVLRFGISIIVARILDPEDFGIMGIAAMLIFYCNSATNFGLNNALVQRKEIDSSHIDSVFTVDLAVSLILTCLLFPLAPLIAIFFHSPESEEVLKVLSVAFILTTFHDLPRALLRRNIAFKLISIVELFRSLSMSLITLVLALSGFKYWSLVWGQLLPLFVATIYLVYKVGWVPRVRYEHASMKQIYSFGMWNFIGGQLDYFNRHVDRFIIGRVFGPLSLGFYDKSVTISRMPLDSIAMNINAVMFPSFSRSQTDKKELKNLFKKAVVLISLINLPILFGCCVVAPYFVLALLGEKWAPMTVPFQILSLSGIVMSFKGLVANFNIAVGNYKKYTIRLGVASLMLLVGCLLLAKFGIIGIAFGVFLFSFFLLIITTIPVKRRLDMSWMEIISIIFPALLSSIVMVSLVKLCSIVFFTSYSIPSLCSLSIIGVASYVVVILCFRTPILNEIKASFYRDCSVLWKKTNSLF